MTTNTGARAKRGASLVTFAGAVAIDSTPTVRARSRRCTHRSRVRCSGPRSPKLAGLRCKSDRHRRCKRRASRWACVRERERVLRWLARDPQAAGSAPHSQQTHTLRERERYASWRTDCVKSWVIVDGAASLAAVLPVATPQPVFRPAQSQRGTRNPDQTWILPLSTQLGRLVRRLGCGRIAPRCLVRCP